MEHDIDRVVEPDDALPELRMADLPPALREAAARASWSELTPVQAKTIPYFTARRDLMVQSRTGSGKTGAFVLPILERIDISRPVCQALILVPTRELARQVAQEVETLCASTGVKHVEVYGGVGYGRQLDAFRNGAHVVVGTPGRILDHLLKQSLSLDDLDILVFDEADRLMGMGFYPDMKQVRSYLPSRDINGYMFSATFPPHVMRLAGEFLHRPEMLSLSRDRVHVAETEHVFYQVPPMEKDRCLVRIIEIENPASAIIFCNTKARVHYVTVVLQRFGYDADELTADLAQTAREKVMNRLKKGNLRILVATDVAARGIDIPDLSHVVQYEPPEDPEVYVHRAGRTGRMGASGEAISLVGGNEIMEIRRIAKRFDIDMLERPLPTDDDVQTIVSQRVTASLEAQLRSRDRIQRERIERFIPMARSFIENEDGLPLVAMLLDDYYQPILQSRPPEPPPLRSPRQSSSPRPRHSDRPGGGRPQRRRN